ncbi:MAG: hypothetical protein G8345_05340 [Magnetococcales bacterium]|nr:hypothetical protein [Magnetococcales bacterium]
MSTVSIEIITPDNIIITTLISLLFGVTGLTLRYYYFRKKSAREARTIISIDDILKGVDNIGSWLTKIKWHPDILVAIPGGGMIIAELLSFIINDYIPIITAFRKERTNDPLLILNSKEKCDTSKYSYYFSMTPMRSQKKILIVDIYLNSGETIELFRNKLIESGVQIENIKVAVIVQSNNFRTGERSSDYHSIESNNYDVEFPWGKAIAAERAKNA